MGVCGLCRRRPGAGAGGRGRARGRLHGLAVARLADRVTLLALAAGPTAPRIPLLRLFLVLHARKLEAAGAGGRERLPTTTGRWPRPLPATNRKDWTS